MAYTNSEKTKQEGELIWALVSTLRPIHWIKNFAVFAAIFLTGFIFDKFKIDKVIWAFVAFCFATSATYIFNDVLDYKNDILHPTKKNRPIASGKLPLPIAFLEAIFFAFMALFITVISPLNSLFLMLIVTYMVLQILYSMGLKNIAILDILIIATGFIIRVYGGAFAIDAHLSVWFLLCVISVALFLASGKRRAELNITKDVEGITRKSLGNYSKELLNSYVTMFGNASWMAWALFTFFESPKATLPFWLVLAELSRTTTINKLMMITIPVTIFGIMRYQSLIFDERSEAPEKLLLTDIPLIIAVVLWVSIVYWVLYSGVSVSGI